MVNSIKDLIVALICVAMLNVAAAHAGVPVAQDLPVVGGDSGVSPSLQQPANALRTEEVPLKVGGSKSQALQSPAVAHIADLREFKTTVVYLGQLPLLSVATGDEPALERASQISGRVNQLNWDRVSADTIRVAFDGRRYRVIAGEDDTVVTIDAAIRLSRTDDISDRATAFQIANRLRRFFGGVPALIDINGPSILENIGVSVSRAFQGLASWYGGSFLGRRTSSGLVLTTSSLFAAHRALPFGTNLRVTNLSNGKQVLVQVQDRGPFHGNRVLDLSPRAANLLGMVGAGIARVRVEVVR